MPWGWAGGQYPPRTVIELPRFVEDAAPVILLSAYAKSAKTNLSTAERNVLRALAPTLLAAFRKEA